MLRNVYVRKNDEKFWIWAEAQAKSQGVALSVWVTNLIRNHKYDLGSKQASEETPIEMLQTIVAKTDLLLATLQKGEANES